MQVNEYYTRNLDNAMHFAFYERVNTLIAEQTFTVPKLAAAKTAYAAAFAKEDAAYGTLRKDARTNLLKDLDTQRDQYYMALNTSLKLFAKSPDAARAAQAQALLDAAKVYTIRVNDSYDRESSKLTNLGQDLTGKYAEQVSALGLTSYVEALVRINEEFKKVFNERLKDQSVQELSALKNARTEVDEAYSRLIALLNAYVLLEDDHAYDELIQNINGCIADSRLRTHKKASSGSSSGGSSAGDDTNPGEDDEPSDGADTPESETPEGGNTPGGDGNGGSSGSDKEDSIG